MSSLVDPDNRRPVDYDRPIRLLDELDAQPPRARELLKNWHDGAVKLFVTSKLLRFRAAEPDLFPHGDYEPLVAAGPKADCVCAFARQNAGKTVIIVVARFPARRESEPDWSGTTIPLPAGQIATKLRDVITGSELCGEPADLSAAAIFRELPVAVLVPEDNSGSRNSSR